jgi:glycerol-3-phosphate dehydrogenase
VDIGIVGGGINGLCCAWSLAKQGHQVHLYERDKLMHATSAASSKLLHGGLRYLENREFRLVREALRERDAWIRRAPHLAKPLRLVMPIYAHSRRPSWMIALGLFLYDHVAGKSLFPKAKRLSKQELIRRDPILKPEGLQGGYEFSDGQMDDRALGMWVAEQAKQAGVDITENYWSHRHNSRRPDHYSKRRSSPPRSPDQCSWSLGTTTFAAKRT